MNVVISLILGHWVLCISKNDQVIKAYASEKLIDALDLANLLQLHVSNIAELPLTQYANQGG